MAQSERFDLAFMDCQMPEMDGYLSKPIRAQSLIDVLQRWVGRGEGGETER